MVAVVAILAAFMIGTAHAAPLDISDAGCPSQSIDLDGGQLVCVSNESPPPPPPPSGAACPVKPVLYSGRPLVGEFTDCGEFTYLRSPDPTDTRHALVDTRTNTLSTCVLDNAFSPARFPTYPDITVAGADKRILLRTNIGANLIVSGQRIQVETLPGYHIGAVVCADGASNVEVNDVCVCP